MSGFPEASMQAHLGIIQHPAALGVVNDDQAWAPARRHIGLQGCPEQVVVPEKEDAISEHR